MNSFQQNIKQISISLFAREIISLRRAEKYCVRYKKISFIISTMIILGRFFLIERDVYRDGFDLHI